MLQMVSIASISLSFNQNKPRNASFMLIGSGKTLTEMDASSLQRTHITHQSASIATNTDGILTLTAAAVHSVKVN